MDNHNTKESDCIGKCCRQTTLKPLNPYCLKKSWHTYIHMENLIVWNNITIIDIDVRTLIKSIIAKYCALEKKFILIISELYWHPDLSGKVLHVVFFHQTRFFQAITKWAKKNKNEWGGLYSIMIYFKLCIWND